MKTVVITGSTRGIGYAMAKEFLKRDCRVVLSGRGETLRKSAQEELKAFEGKYCYVSCDVQRKSDLEKLPEVLQVAYVSRDQAKAEFTTRHADNSVCPDPPRRPPARRLWRGRRLRQPDGGHEGRAVRRL